MTGARHAVPDAVCAAAVAGDRAAREEIVRALGPRVLMLCRRLSPSADDSFQAVWERVFRSLHRFDPAGPASLATWVSTLAHRHLVDERRHRGRIGVTVELREVPGRGPSVEEELVSAERRAALEMAMADLPDPMRRLIVAHHLGGVALASIAEDEGLPVGTVKSRLHAARARMLDALRRSP